MQSAEQHDHATARHASYNGFTPTRRHGASPHGGVSANARAIASPEDMRTRQHMKKQHKVVVAGGVGVIGRQLVEHLASLPE